MKVLKLSKDLAYMMCAGFIKGYPKKTNCFSPPECAIIFSEEMGNNESLPLELEQEIFNHLVFGDIPPINKMAVGKAIGFVCVSHKQIKDGDDICTRLFEGTCYEVFRPRLFDEPLQVNLESIEKMNKDFLKVFPCHEVNASRHYSNDDNLYLEVSKEIIDFASGTGGFELEMTKDMEKVFLDEDGNLKQLKKFCLCWLNRIKRFSWNKECFIETDKSNPKRRRIILSCNNPF